MFREKARNPVSAVETTITILETIKQNEGATLQTLDDQLEFAKSTIHRHLSTLQQERYITKTGDEFNLSFHLFSLASYNREKNPLFHIGRPTADEVARQIDERVSLVVPEYGRAVKCYIAESDRSITTDSHLGLAMNMHCTSGGKAILAFKDSEYLDAVIEAHDLQPKTDNTITKCETLLEELAEIREQKVAFDNQERITGVRGIASPVFGKTPDDVLGAIDVAGPATRFGGETFREDLPNLLRQAADEISVNIQYWRES